MTQWSMSDQTCSQGSTNPTSVQLSNLYAFSSLSYNISNSIYRCRCDGLRLNWSHVQNVIVRPPVVDRHSIGNFFGSPSSRDTSVDR
mmetsp:Transcript_45429/g.96612  ORF Transcript_45429/g.96612 Transcript_45429/m.96612 type:complete len:87 (-) Transcript_45429:630-890(-)